VGNLINFRWSSAVSGLQYQVELDNNSDFLTQVAGFPSAFSSLNYYNLEYTLASLPAGTYYWRVKSYTAGGVKVTISPTWSFNIAGPPTASPIYPTNGEIIYTLYPTIYWQLNNNFNSTPAYARVRVGTAPGGPYNTVVSVPTLNNYIVLSGLELATTYYYVIEVSTGLPFSVVTTSAEGSFAMLYASLANVPIYQTFPVTGTTVYSLTPTLYWFLGLHLPGVTFDLQIDDEPTFALPRIATQTGLTNLNYESPLLTAGSTYYWRVSINGAGTWYSQSFLVDANAVNTTTNAAVIPTPTSPAPTSGVVIFTQSPTLQWVASSTQPLEYQVIWSELPGLNAGVLSNISAPNGGQSGWLIINEYNVPGLAAGKTYYWQVRSRLASNNAVISNYSSVAQFTVSPGASPVVVLPANPIVGASINSTTANLSWIVPAKSTSVITYDLELAMKKDMSDAVVIRDIDKASYKVAGLNSSTTYFWRVQSKTSEGEKSNYSYLGEFNTGTGITGVEEIAVTPNEFSLEQNYPNPFNPTTTIKYSLPENSFVTIRIFDMLGREVNTLVNKEMTAGTHSINWSGEDSFGMKVTSGTYVYRISSGKFNSVKKMVLIK
jgi:hypothetical protein